MRDFLMHQNMIGCHYINIGYNELDWGHCKRVSANQAALPNNHMLHAQASIPIRGTS